MRPPTQLIYLPIWLLIIFLDQSVSFVVGNRDIKRDVTRNLKIDLIRDIDRIGSCSKMNTRKYMHLPDFDPVAIQHSFQGFTDIFQGALGPASSTSELTSVVLTAEEPAASLNPLGNDLLIFLCATIGIVPLFKWLGESPVIGFLAAGLLMGPAGLGLFSDLQDMESLADFGVLFLLFEQGLELTVDRLKSLSKFAFGMGTLQVVLCTGAFFTFPFIGGVQFLEFFMGSDSALVDITRVDESLVIGAALCLSSSAFVLKILQEKGQLTTKFGAACLGTVS
jgi:hypothetical protein